MNPDIVAHDIPPDPPTNPPVPPRPDIVPPPNPDQVPVPPGPDVVPVEDPPGRTPEPVREPGVGNPPMA